MIIYPAVDIQEGQCVRLKQGDFKQTEKVAESPLKAAMRWEKEGASYLHVVDLDGAKHGQPRNLEAIKQMADALSIPLQLGGGIRTTADMAKAFKAGAARVIIGTKAVTNPQEVHRAVVRFPERIAVGIDAREGKAAVQGWLEDTEKNVVDLALHMKELGVGEIIYTDIRRDGMLKGPDLAGLVSLLKTDIKVIASGGVSTIEDIRQLKELESAGLSGIIVGRALYNGQISFKEAQRTVNKEVSEKNVE